ncbi:MAG: HD domain-containing protein [Acidobacteriota bacterium]
MDHSPRFEEALVYAARLHADQRRKGSGTPYVSHLLGVAGLVIEDGGSEDEAIAALLHDAAEDRGGRAQLETIAERFGPDVARIVEACSDSLAEVKEPWRDRKERHLAALQSASPSAIRVALADKVHNLRAIVADYRGHGEALWERFNEDADHVWYYGAALDLLGRRSRSVLVAELERSYAELRALVAAAPHPIADSYWVVPGRLLAGEYPGERRPAEAKRKLRRLSWSGVNAFVDLTEAAEYGLVPYAPLLPDTASHERRPIPDMDVVGRAEMAEILDAVDRALDAGRTVYVHCFGGRGRTGTVVGCWLVRHGSAPEAALSRITELRRGTPDGHHPSPETGPQIAMVRTWSG